MDEQETAQEQFNRRVFEILSELSVTVEGLLPDNKVRDFNKEKMQPIKKALSELDALLTLIPFQRGL